MSYPTTFELNEAMRIFYHRYGYKPSLEETIRTLEDRVLEAKAELAKLQVE